MPLMRNGPAGVERSSTDRRPAASDAAPGGEQNMLGVVNGTTLYVLDRRTGDLLWQTEVEGVPTTGPCMTDRAWCWPRATGWSCGTASNRLTRTRNPRARPAVPAAKVVQAGPVVIRLSQDARRRWRAQSAGQSTGPPIMLTSNEDEDLVAWATDQGAAMIAAYEHATKRFVTRHRFLAGNGTAAGLAYGRRKARLPPTPA